MYDLTYIRFGTGLPLGSAPQGATYYDTANNYQGFVFSSGGWHQIITGNITPPSGNVTVGDLTVSGAIIGPVTTSGNMTVTGAITANSVTVPRIAAPPATQLVITSDTGSGFQFQNTAATTAQLRLTDAGGGDHFTLGSGTGNASATAEGASANIGFAFNTKGNGPHAFYNNGNLTADIKPNATTLHSAVDSQAILIVTGPSAAVRLGQIGNIATVQGVDPTGVGSFQALQLGGSSFAFGNVPAILNALNDAAAAGLGVPVGGIYRNGSIMMLRVA